MFIRMTDFIVPDAVNEQLSHAAQKYHRLYCTNWALYKAPYLLGTRNIGEATPSEKLQVYNRFFSIIFPHYVISMRNVGQFRRATLAG